LGYCTSSQSPDHHYQFQKKAFPVGYGDPPKPWQSRSCIDYLHTMVLLEAHGEQFYISLQHAKFLGMAAMNDKLSRTLRE
jgi:lipopolysaccharide biosynthesis glycosyltransferase